MKVSKINIAASMTALLLLLSWGNPALAFCRDSPDSQCHKDITKSALGNVAPLMLLPMQLVVSVLATTRSPQAAAI